MFQMRRVTANILLLLTIFFGTSQANDSVGDNSIVYRRNFRVDEKEIGEIQIFNHVEPADTVYEFGKRHNLDATLRSQILDDVCTKVSCSRKRAIIFQTPVSHINELIGVFELFDGIEPVDAAHEFVTRYGLSIGYRDAILSEACKVVECERVQPVVWRKPIKINESLHDLIILEGQEPADEIYKMFYPLGVPYAGRLQILNEAKRNGVESSRDVALVFSKTVLNVDGSIAGTVLFYDNEQEPVDVLYKFVTDHSLNEYWQIVRDKIMSEVCTNMICRRTIPVVWKQTLSGEDGKILGTVEVLLEQEPVDAIDVFVQVNRLNMGYRDNILRLACEKLSCTRTTPVVFRKEVNIDHEKELGSVEILEGQEVIDAVVQFIQNLEVTIDEIALKNYFFEQACGNPRLKCTRNIAYLFDKTINKEDGTEVGQLIIKEHEEPVDVINEWCNTNGLDENFLFSLIQTICGSKKITCKRQAPLMFGPQALTDTDGKVVGAFEVMLRQEPIDALYGFFSKHHLHGKWDMRAVFNQLCALPGLLGKCQRQEAIKYYEENFSIGNLNIGPVVIWEPEEVVDKLYKIRQEFNLTVIDQMTKLTEICRKEEVHCERTKAVVYRVKDINKNDFAKFGNETCLRRYAGWQFLSSTSNTKMGEKLTKFMQKEQVQMAVEHPLFGPLLFLVVNSIINVILCSVGGKRYNYCYRLLIFASVFVWVSYLQVLLVEPIDEVDKAMHIHEGKLPDLIIYEGDEPVDAIMKWGKEASKIHHPIVREPIYWELLEQTCNKSGQYSCERKRAWEEIDMGSITQFGQKHDILHLNPEVDPNARHSCISVMDGKSNSCIQNTAIALCTRLIPQPERCVQDISLHISGQLDDYNDRRHHSKNAYIKMGLEMDSPTHELFEKTSNIARKHGLNVSPYKRVDNGTVVYEKFDRNSDIAWSARDAFHKVKDPESREWNDKPCEPLFGGAMCAKTDKDGNMQIEC